MTSTETRIKITTLATSIIFIILFISSFVIIQVVSVSTPRKRAGAVQQEGALCLWEKPCRERHGWGWSLFLFVSRSKQKGRKINKSDLKKMESQPLLYLWHERLTFWISWYLWQNVQFKKYLVDNLHAQGFFQAIFNHMGPNMARGWQGDSAGTKVIIFPSSCICLGALNFCCNQISYFFCLISIISCYLGEAWRGATWQQNCTNTKGSLFICSIYRICESSNCDTRVANTNTNT